LNIWTKNAEITTLTGKNQTLQKSLDFRPKFPLKNSITDLNFDFWQKNLLLIKRKKSKTIKKSGAEIPLKKGNFGKRIFEIISISVQNFLNNMF